MRRALEFGRPDRAPRQLWMLPIVWREHSKEAVEGFIAQFELGAGGKIENADAVFDEWTRGTVCQ